MCTGVPMTVVSVQGLMALCEGAQGKAHIDVSLVGPVAPGDRLLTHVGTAIRLLEAEEAALIADALEAARRAAAGEPFEHLLADLLNRDPTLPPHLRKDAPAERENDDGRTPPVL